MTERERVRLAILEEKYHNLTITPSEIAELVALREKERKEE